MPPRQLQLVAFLLLVVFGLTGCTTAPRVWTERAPLSAEAREALNLKVFDRAANRVEDKFFDKELRGVDWPAATARHREAARRAKNDEELYAAINALLRELGESHTMALPPREAFYDKTRMRVMTGFMMYPLEGSWVITRVFAGSSAEAAGVRPGWLVRSRDGRPMDAGPRPFTMEPGQEIVFEFVDEQDVLRKVTLVAGPVGWQSRRESRVLDDGTLYLAFDRFDVGTIRWLSAQLEAHPTAPAAIVDLRDNPGGLLFSVRFAVAEFFPKKVEIGTFVRRGGRELGTGTLTWGSAKFAGKVAVLVNGLSASSSEIFAHVLQHHDRAIVVGNRTAGAVIASMGYGLPDGGFLQVPVLDYVGLDGKRLEGRGVTPDIPVTVSLALLRSGRDLELEAARAALHAVDPVPTS